MAPKTGKTKPHKTKGEKKKKEEKGLNSMRIRSLVVYLIGMFPFGFYREWKKKMNRTHNRFKEWEYVHKFSKHSKSIQKEKEKEKPCLFNFLAFSCQSFVFHFLICRFYSSTHCHWNNRGNARRLTSNTQGA